MSASDGVISNVDGGGENAELIEKQCCWLTARPIDQVINDETADPAIRR